MFSLLRTKSLLWLILLPIVCAASVFLFNNVSLVADETALNMSHSYWWAALIVMCIALFLVLQNQRYLFLRQSSPLPAFIYVFGVARLIPSFGVNNSLWATVVLVLLLFSAENAINNRKDNVPLFWVGVLTIIFILFFPQGIFLFLWPFLLLAFIGRFAIKDVMALFIGMLTAAIFILFTLFWYDKFGYLEEQLDLLLGGDEVIGIYSPTEWIRLAALVVLGAIISIASVTKYMVPVFAIKRMLLAYVTLILFLTVTVIVFRGIEHDFFYIVSVPLTWLTSYFLFSCKNGTAYIYFFVFLLICFWR